MSQLLSIQTLLQYPACQKRTGKNKKFTLLIDNQIYKGPYTTEEANHIINKIQTLTKWQTDYLVPVKNVYQVQEGIMLIYENMGVKAQPQTLINQETFSTYQYNVIQSCSKLPKVTDIIEKKEGAYIFNLATQMTLSLIKFLLANVGDRGLYNVIADPSKQTVYFIDVDEDAWGSKDKPTFNDAIRDSAFFYLSKEMKQSYQQKWIQNVDAKTLISRLEKEVDSPHVPTVVNLIKKYYSPQPFTTQETKQITQINTQSFTGQSSFSTQTTAQVYLVPRVGYMGKTNSGIAIDVVKSGLQKYIRRGMTDKALMCANELWQLRNVENGIRVVENGLLGRLQIIAFEDIGPANMDLAFTVVSSLENYANKNINNLSLAHICTVVQMLAESKHSRLFSWFNTTYGRLVAENKIALAIKYNIPIDSFESKSLKSNVQKFAEVTGVLNYTQNENLITCASELYQRITERSLQAFTWMNYFRLVVDTLNKNTKNLFKRIGTRVVPEALLWQVVRAGYAYNLNQTPLSSMMSLNNTTSDGYLMGLLETMFYTHIGDQRVFLLAAVWLAITTEPIKIVDLTPNINIWAESKTLTQLNSMQYQLQIDSFIVDMHTSEGRKSGKSSKDFKREGSVVENEDQLLLQKYKPLFQVYQDIEYT